MGNNSGREALRRLRDPGDALWGRIFEDGYLVLLGLEMLLIFRTTTMLGAELIGWMDPLVLYGQLLLLLFVGAKAAWERSWRPAELLVAVVFCGALLRSFQRVERDFVVELALLFAGAHGVDFKKILRVWLAVTGAATLLTVLLALSGAAENLVYTRGGQTRQSLGFLYPTDFAARVFFLAAGWAFLRGRRITVWEIAGIVLLAALCHALCDARNSALCLLLLAAGLAYVKLRRARGEKRRAPYAMARPVRWILVLAAPILAAGMNVLTRFYDNRIGWLDRLDDLLSYRLSVGHRGFAAYSVKLFGQDIPMNGLGGTDGNIRIRDYFFLDSSYVNLLLCFGLVTLLCVLGVWVLSSLRESRRGAWERLGVLALVALHCLLEHHMLEVVYDVFLLLPLAAEPAPPERNE